MSFPPCPTCGRPVIKADRTAPAFITETRSGLFGGIPGEQRRFRNPDRSGVAFHDDGTSCPVSNFDELFVAK